MKIYANFGRIEIEYCIVLLTSLNNIAKVTEMEFNFHLADSFPSVEYSKLLSSEVDNEEEN